MNFLGPAGARGVLTEEEKKSMPKVSKQLLLRIFSYLKPYIPQFILVSVVILVSVAVGLLPPILMGRIVDEALANADMALLIKLLLFAFGALAASRVIGVMESYINAWISQQIVYDMRGQMYDHLQRMPHAFFTSERQGDIITRMNTDISGVSVVISKTLSSAFSNLLTVVSTLIAMFMLDWRLALVGIAIIPLILMPTKIVGRKRWSLTSASQEQSDNMNQLIDETLSVSGSLLVKLFTREKEESRRFNAVSKKLSQINTREQRNSSWFLVTIGLFSELGPLLIYFAGGLLIVGSSGAAISIGTITAMVALVNRMYRPVENLSNVSVDFTRSLALFTRIFDYFDRSIGIVSPENGSKPDFSTGAIEYKNVSFSYDAENPILKDISFAVPAGQMYAIVGPSGAGKSTVVNLLPRLYDVTGGSVCIGGDDVRSIDLEYLRSAIGVVTQEAYLFNGTILDNLKYAKPDATTEEIENACKIANIHEFISRQPQGYLTEVGNRGLKLSGGEKQRISIARVVLKDPEVLILDEATSALDSISESCIQEALDRIMVGRTSIVIAHRLTTILKADRILVVAGGVIAEQGTHDELLALGGIYRELYETQFRKVLEMENENADSSEN